MAQGLDAPHLLAQAVNHHLRQLGTQLNQGLLNFAEQGFAGLCKGGPKFVQQTPQGVGLQGAHLHHQLALAVQGERGLLLHGFDTHKLDPGLLHGQPDGPGVSGVCFVACNEGANSLGVQQANAVAQSR